MKTKNLTLTALTALGLTLSSTSQAGTNFWDFDDWYGPAVTNLTLASTLSAPEFQGWSGGNPGGYLQITKAAGSQNLEVVFPDIDDGAPIKAFRLTADLRVGNGNEVPADGFSISYVRENDPALSNALNQVVYPGAGWPYDPTIYFLNGFAGGDSAGAATDPAGGALPENGSKTGVAIAFDAWAGNWLPDTGTGGTPGPDRVGIAVRVDDHTLIQKAMAEANQNCANTNSMQTGPYDTNAPNSPDGLQWCRLEVEKTTNNLLTVIWKGSKILDNYSIAGYSVHRGRLILAGRTGGNYQNVQFDNISLVTVPAIEATFENLTLSPTLRGWSFTLQDTGPSVVTNIVSILWNGVNVTSQVGVTRNGAFTTGTYTQIPRLVPNSTNQVVVTYQTAIGQTLVGIGNATTPDYFAMPVAYALPFSAVSGQPRGIALGPTWQTIAQNRNSQGDNRLNWTEEQLLGLHGANLITGTWPTTADILDYQNNGADGTATANFRVNGSTTGYWDGPDFDIKGLGFGSNASKTSTDDGTIEWFAYVNFPAAGMYEMVVNSDDGFRLTAARNAKDRMGDVVSVYEGGRGSSTGIGAGPIKTIVVDQAGVYPMRGIIENQGGGFNVEWYTRVNTTNLCLVNSNATPGALQTWQSVTGAGCYVKSAIPVRSAVDVAGNQNIVIELGDGTTTVTPGSIVLKVDGNTVSPTRTGLRLELAPIGAGNLWASGSSHTILLTFTDSASTPYSYTWTFQVAPYQVLPIALRSAPGTGTDPGFRVNLWQKSPLAAPYNIVNGWRNMLALGNQVAEGFYPTNAADLSSFTHGGSAWTSVINYGQDSPGPVVNVGNFQQPTYPDVVFPGLPGIGMPNADNDAATFRCFLEFPAAGYYTLGVNSDDGFRLTVGDSMGPAKTPVKVLKPAALFGDKVALQTQNGLEGGAFGGPLPASPGIIAQAVKADPILAGGPLNNAAAMVGKICLVQRGTYSFYIKCLNAKAAGAIACVMVNNNDDLPGIFGGADSTLNDYPCITVGKAVGDPLLAAATTGTDSPLWMRLGDDDSQRLGQFDGGRGSSDTTFGIYVPAAGLYPVRLLWMNGGGGLNCEFFNVDINGTKTLIGDAACPIKAYINRPAPPAGTMNPPVNLGSAVSISWAGQGELQMALDINGPWFKASWQTSPVVVPIVPELAPMYFRLRSY